jgi:hypothetical protein
LLGRKSPKSKTHAVHQDADEEVEGGTEGLAKEDRPAQGEESVSSSSAFPRSLAPRVAANGVSGEESATYLWKSAGRRISEAMGRKTGVPAKENTMFATLDIAW